MKKLALPFFILLAFWPVWYWFVLRYSDGSDEPLGVLALLSAIAISLLVPAPREWVSPRRRHRRTVTGWLFIVLYVVTYPVAPQSVHAVLAIIAMAFLFSGFLRTVSLNAGTWLLVLLSMPIVANLNFYLGYPLRLLSAAATAMVLKLSGFAVAARSTELILGGQVVEVDAPCSGIKMLWFAAYMAALFSAYYRLSWGRTLALCCVAGVSAVASNVARVTSLFLLETGHLKVEPLLEDVLHQGIGVAAFIACALTLVLIAKRLQVQPCSPADGAGVRDAPRMVLSNFPRLSRVTAIFLLIVFALPFLPAVGEQSKAPHFSGWPTTFDGQVLAPKKLTEKENTWLSGFPGKVAAFSDGKKTIVMRWVTQPTRQLHPSSDCYRAVGYSVKWQPLILVGGNGRWGCFEARRGNETLSVREKIFDEKGNTWSDVSSWYWAAALKQSASPWWMITVVERK